MKITFLGTGTSTGVPEIGCQCEVCTSKDPRDWRLRTSVLVETGGKTILLDCGPDFRWQMITNKTYHLDAVLISHEHYDHVGGLDDLRPFCRVRGVDIYAEDYVAEAIETRIPYAFRIHKYPGVPNLELHRIGMEPFEAAGLSVIPIRVMHGRLPILGYRIGNMAYLTDLKYLPEEEYAKLEGLDMLIIMALRKEDQPHPTHETLGEALVNIARIAPKESYLIHMGHRIGLHAVVEKELPPHVHLAYDGLKVEL
ncbi:MBL fold metallo-hydrolase [Parabacteroides provencensis]|uniref:MBL fold metallo-hydrolase n=1 Tax=Parabacteroides provencensis TaxID=1944636 RepID=UPI000C14A566|nr:MBL fold metallo-hydrolase [Parabacteroides provencensis]